MTISHQLLLTLFPQLYAIARFSPHERIAVDYAHSSFFSLTKTNDELSVVCEQKDLPSGVRSERDRRLLRVDSVISFELTGVLCSLTVPLANADISIFAVSTFDSDYLLIANRDIEPAIVVLENAGHKVHRSPS
ncbi:MAG: ACT domain-containing protein [Candidatus Acidiferrum sp.]|jgi:hypothetical protein